MTRVGAYAKAIGLTTEAAVRGYLVARGTRLIVKVQSTQRLQ